MADPDRTKADHLTFEQALAKEPYQYSFYQALRRLECFHADKPRIGQAGRLSDEPLRIGQDPSMTFAPASLSSFKPLTEKPARLGVQFQGMLGPNGPLPLHLTEYAYDRMHNHADPTFARFLDVFNHRMLSFMYRAWADAQPVIHHDRPRSDGFARYVGALFGLGMPSLRNRDSIPDAAKLFFAGRMACQTGHAEGLQTVLEEFFHVPFFIEEFVGEWVMLPDDCHFRLGESPDTGTLDENMMVGESFWSRQDKFRVVAGPLTLEDYERFMPGSVGLKQLTDMVRQYAGDSLTWDLNLILKKEEIPGFRLSETGYLNWNMWVVSEQPDEDVADLILDPFE